jgi:hypothetical protein
MIEAMYGLEFISNQNDGGHGVIILETGRAFGGDSSFIYIGEYTVRNQYISAKVKCTNDRRVLQSIFGAIDEFNLILEGALDHEQMTLQGHMVENPDMQVAVRLTRRAELP